MEFTKLHGNGNDFVLVDEHDETLVPEEEKPGFARGACDRHFGIGGDGVLFLSGDEVLEMRIFNSDGSEADMCGNGIRCFVKYALDQGYASPGKVEVETGAGILAAETEERRGETWVSVEMGEPDFQCGDIPAVGSGRFQEEIAGFDVYAANTGVPHAVVFVDDVKDIGVEEVAPEIRFADCFRDGANVNFVEVTGEDSLKVRTFERGVEGETLSCGTGATAAAVVAHDLGKVGENVDVETNGGPLTIEAGEIATLKGPAVEVFEGKVEQESLPEDRPR